MVGYSSCDSCQKIVKDVKRVLMCEKKPETKEKLKRYHSRLPFLHLKEIPVIRKQSLFRKS